MLKFFKRIRRKLIDGGNLKRYLVYAIGEILLVMAGILLALQVNNWNEKRKDKIVEKQILEGIHGDLLQDTIDINYNIRRHYVYIEYDSAVLQHIFNREELTPSFSYQFARIFWGDWDLILHTSYFEEAKQKGLSIITNTHLREDISRLYEFRYPYLLMAENGMQVVDHFGHASPERNKYLETDSSLINSPSRFRRFSLNEMDYERILSDKKLHALILNNMMLKKQKLEEYYLPTRRMALEIVAAIEKELEEFD